VRPESETFLYRDFSERTTGELRLLLRDTFSPAVLDTTIPGQPRLTSQSFYQATLMPAHIYHVSPEVTNRVGVGVTVATAPPLDPNQSLAISPAFIEQLFYTRETWYAYLTANYDYGTTSPRIGVGPTQTVALTFVGIPFPSGTGRNFALLANAAGSHGTFRVAAGPSNELGIVSAAATIRYALGPWIGVTTGYDFRYATLTGGPLAAPPLTRHVFFVGLSGNWSTDRIAPPLTAFQPPIAPPG
jgi:hypothetical protein